jgi:hypothetical protein
MTLPVRIIRQETDRAIQVILPDLVTFLWLPRSQIESEDYRAGDEHCTLVISDWIAQEKGIR